MFKHQINPLFPSLLISSTSVSYFSSPSKLSPEKKNRQEHHSPLPLKPYMTNKPNVIPPNSTPKMPHHITTTLCPSHQNL